MTVPTTLTVATLVKAAEQQQQPPQIVVQQRSPVPPPSATVNVQVNIPAPTQSSHPTPPPTYTSPRPPVSNYNANVNASASSNSRKQGGILVVSVSLLTLVGTCQECRSDITGDMIVYNHLTFHPEHFICHKWYGLGLAYQSYSCTQPSSNWQQPILRCQ